MSEHMTAEEYRKLIENAQPDGRLPHITADKKGKEEEKYRNYMNCAKGNNFENDIIKGCKLYGEWNRAIIRKVPEPYRVVKKFPDGQFAGRHTGRAEPDFKGILQSRKMIVFEAKQTNKDRIAASVLTKPQAEWLEKHEKMGALSFVCVNINDRYFMLPWENWSNMKEIYGRKYVTADDIFEYEIGYDGALHFLDYIHKNCKIDFI